MLLQSQLTPGKSEFSFADYIEETIESHDFIPVHIHQEVQLYQ